MDAEIERSRDPYPVTWVFVPETLGFVLVAVAIEERDLLLGPAAVAHLEFPGG